MSYTQHREVHIPVCLEEVLLTLVKPEQNLPSGHRCRGNTRHTCGRRRSWRGLWCRKPPPRRRRDGCQCRCRGPSGDTWEGRWNFFSFWPHGWETGTTKRILGKCQNLWDFNTSVIPGWPGQCRWRSKNQRPLISWRGEARQPSWWRCLSAVCSASQPRLQVRQLDSNLIRSLQWMLKVFKKSVNLTNRTSSWQLAELKEPIKHWTVLPHVDCKDTATTCSQCV